VRAEVEAAGVVLGVCEEHGAAIVGEAGCDRCGADEPRKRGEPQARAGGAREPRPVVALQRAPVSRVIWGENAPDAPIAAPARRGVGLSVEDAEAAADRVRASLRHPTAVAAPPPGAVPPRRIEHPAPSAPAHHEPPAAPAEEDSMPKGKRSEPMTCCGSMGSRHMGNCKERGKAPKPPPPARGARAARKVVVLRRPGAPARPPDVESLLAKREGLMTERNRIDAALGQVNADLLAALSREEQRVEKLRTAVHEAAQRAAGGA
jgi:hypothetical protein